MEFEHRRLFVPNLPPPPPRCRQPSERPRGHEAGQEARQRPLRQPGGAVQEEAAEFRRQKRAREEEQVVRLLAAVYCRARFYSETVL